MLDEQRVKVLYLEFVYFPSVVWRQINGKNDGYLYDQPLSWKDFQSKFETKRPNHEEGFLSCPGLGYLGLRHCTLWYCSY